MATIDEIFDTMPAEASVPYEELIVDAENRKIIVPDAEAIFGVESDTQSERKHFRCPRYVGNELDLAACFLRVNFRNANGDVDSYLIEDTAIDGEYITFSWVFSKKVTAYKGAVKFNLCAIMGAGLPEWNTTLAEGTVLEGLEPDSSTVEAETADVVAQLLATVAAQTAAVEAVGAAQVAAVTEAGNNATEEAKAAVEAKGEAVRATIPEDYSTLSATVDKLTRDRAAAIVCEAEGETIQVADSSADPLVGLRIFGKSTQDGTPTPDAPVEIVSAKAPTVTVCGKNLIPFPYKEGTVTKNGVTFTVQDDGAIHLKGTATKAANLSIFSGSLPLQGTFTLSGAVNEANPSTHYLQPYVDGVFQAAQFSVGQTYDINGNLTALTLYVKEGATVDCVVRPQLESGAVATEYEAPTAQTLALTTPTALPGIPVSSGGNYTDANGQQWIADEIDLNRGVYVQRVAVERLTTATHYNESGLYLTLPVGKSKYDSVYICSHFTAGIAYANGATGAYASCVLPKSKLPATITNLETGRAWLDEQNAAGTPVIAGYVLTNPIETPLSTEEIGAYKALIANKPTTTVLNDAGAWMALEYAADPKTYIDNKIAALLAANN